MAEPSQIEAERWEWQRQMQIRPYTYQYTVEVKCMMCGMTFTTTEEELADAEGFFADCDCCGGIAIRAERFKVLDMQKLLLCKRVCMEYAGYFTHPFTDDGYVRIPYILL